MNQYEAKRSTALAMIHLTRNLCKGHIKLSEVIEARDAKYEHIREETSTDNQFTCALFLVVKYKTKLGVVNYDQGFRGGCAFNYYAAAFPEAVVGQELTVYGTQGDEQSVFNIVVTDPNKFYYLNTYGFPVGNWWGNLRIEDKASNTNYNGKTVFIVNMDNDSQEEMMAYRIDTLKRYPQRTVITVNMNHYKDFINKERNNAATQIQRWWRTLPEKRAAAAKIKEWWREKLYAPGTGLFYQKAATHFECCTRFRDSLVEYSI